MSNFTQTFKNIDDILYKDSGADSEIDYIEQSSWVLFLRYLQSLEQDKEDQASLEGKDYQYILEEKYRWDHWAKPEAKDGVESHHLELTGPELVQFVQTELFPYLAEFKNLHIDNPKTIGYKIGEIFSELNNKVKSG